MTARGKPPAPPSFFKKNKKFEKKNFKKKKFKKCFLKKINSKKKFQKKKPFKKKLRLRAVMIAKDVKVFYLSIRNKNDLLLLIMCAGCKIWVFIWWFSISKYSENHSCYIFVTENLQIKQAKCLAIKWRHDAILRRDIMTCRKTVTISSRGSSILCNFQFRETTRDVRFVPQITGIVLDGSYVCFPDITTIDIYSWLIYWFTNSYKSFLYFKHLVSAFKLSYSI